MWQVKSWFSLEQKAVVLCQVMQIKKIDCDVMMTSRTPYGTHHDVVINRAKFDTYTSSSFRGAKTDRQTDRQNYALYVR